MSPRFRCPACGFTVFNRRVSRCEACSAELPAHFQLTAVDLGHIVADHARNERARAELKREAEAKATAGARRRADGGGDGAGGLLDGLADGLGGGDD